MAKKNMHPIHPGEILQEEFLTPLDVSQSKLARDIDVPHRRINEIIRGKRSVSPDTAMRLARYFGTTPEFWMSLQATYDLRILLDEKHSVYDDLPSISHKAA